MKTLVFYYNVVHFMNCTLFRQKDQLVPFLPQAVQPLHDSLYLKHDMVSGIKVAEDKWNAAIITDSPCFPCIMQHLLVAQSKYYVMGHKAQI